MKYRVIRETHPATFIHQPINEEEERTEEITLTFEELEAITLTNMENLNQRDAADNMHISQPTFHRLLNDAYFKLAQFLLNGKILKIEGGNYMIAQTERRFLCYDCKAEFSVPYGTPRPANCPQCNSTNIHRPPDDTGARYRGGRDPGGGRGRGGQGRGGAGPGRRRGLGLGRSQNPNYP